MISVVLPTCDRLGPLHRTLRSLARQRFRDFETIVVNDGGRSPTPVVRAWRDELDITLVSYDDRGGPSHARNVGLEAARGDHLAFLDDDDIFFATHLAAADRALSEGECDAVYGGAVVSPRWAEALPADADTLPCKDYEFDEAFLLVANYIHTGAVVCRNFSSSAARFDEELTVCEDWDMWITMRRSLGYRFAFLGARTTVYHQVSHRPSLVTEACHSSPTLFTRAHRSIYAKWPTADPLVRGYRAWFAEFDRRLDACIDLGSPIPEHVFENAVRLSYGRFRRGEPPDPAWLDGIFDLPRGDAHAGLPHRGHGERGKS